jgi:hypothetical protein
LANINTIVDLIHPTASGIGIITTDQIWVVFDRELDEDSITGGNFFITGPDQDTWSGPDLQLFLDRESVGGEIEILQSPDFAGIVQGDITFERIATDSLTTVSGIDTVGSGFIYRTKAIFTPTRRLQVNTEYDVYLSGDEDDTDLLQTGISSRTVFDTSASGANTGTGGVDFSGGYIGLAAEDTYRLAITTGGDVGTAKFTFVRDTDPVSVFGPFKTKESGVLLSDGVTATFDEGSYVAGDQWSVIVKERDIFANNLYWTFKTGSGSITTIPDTTATSVIGDPAPETEAPSATAVSAFSVSSTSPADEATNLTLPTSTYDITVTFNNSIDATTVVSGVDISVLAESVTGEVGVPANEELIVEPSVSGTQLTLTVASGQLLANNVVTVTLDSTIADTDGTALGTDYSFWFTTAYNPMFCGLRQQRLRIGAFIGTTSDDTVNLAIHMASKEADLLTWNRDNLTDDYYVFTRNQWTCCRAAQLLLINTIGGSGSIRSKRLGDLEVSYNTDIADTSVPLSRTEECLLKWEGAILAGGRQVQEPKMVVKGEQDIDRPPIGRGWLHTRDIYHPQNAAGNRRLRLEDSRRYRNTYSRKSYRKGWWDR